MGVAARLAGHRPQAEALVGVEIGGLELAVVEHQRFALADLEVKLAVVGAVDGIGDDLLDAFLGNVELADQAVHGASRFKGNSLPDVGAPRRSGNAGPRGD